MLIFVPKESRSSRTARSADARVAKKLVGLGAVVEIEPGMGSPAGFTDPMYTRAGATVSSDPRDRFLPPTSSSGSTNRRSRT